MLGASKVSLLSRRVLVSARGDALVRLRCAGAGDCSVKLALATTRTSDRKSSHKPARVLALGASATRAIAPGERVVKVRLAAVGRRLLHAARGRLSVVLTLLVDGRRQHERVELVAPSTGAS
jgi:hypothetical protein